MVVQKVKSAQMHENRNGNESVMMLVLCNLGPVMMASALRNGICYTAKP